MFCSPLLIKFDSPCGANGFINHDGEFIESDSFPFSKLTSQEFIFLICLIQIAGS